MDYQFQPEGSNWCWAACLSNMIIGLRSISSIGNSQCHLVSHYKSYLQGAGTNTESTICCSSGVPHGCNLRLDDAHLKYIFEKSGFLITEYSSISQLSSFDFIVEELKKNQAPILLKTRVSDSAHMVLINGYGTKTNGCNYILISNPDNSHKERYFNHEYYLKNNTVEKFWTAKIENRENLGRDKMLDFNYNFIKTTLQNKLNKDLGDVEMLNPWNYLDDQNASLFSMILDDTKDNLSIDDFSLIKEEYEGCKVDQNRSLVNVGSIKFVKEEDLLRFEDYASKEGYTYFKGYSIHAHVRFADNDVKIRPILFPKNYNLVNSEYPLKAFLKVLDDLKEYKTSSFLN